MLLQLFVFLFLVERYVTIDFGNGGTSDVDTFH